MRLRSGDAELEYHVLGSGPAVVLLHPFPAHHGIWVPVAETLSVRYRCVVPDLRGHGASEPGGGPATMQKHAEDLERICRDAGVKRAVFAGSSIGGYILFEYWRRHRPRIAGLVLCGTRAQADNEQVRAARLQSAEDVQKRGPDAFLDSMAEKLIGATTRRNRPDLAAEARAFMSKMSVAGIVAIQQGMAARPDSVETLKTIDVPTLIIHGDEDLGVSVSDAELMHRSIRGSRLEIIPQAGHYVVFEQQIAVARIIRQFLDGLSWE